MRNAVKSFDILAFSLNVLLLLLW